MTNARTINKRFISKGFSVLGKPAEPVPSCPTNITGISGEELGNFVTLYNAWREYTEDMLVREKMRLAILQDRYDHKYKILWLSVQKTSTVKDKEFSIDVAPELRELKEELLEVDLFVEALTAKVDSYTNTLAMLSREITRRSNGRF